MDKEKYKKVMFLDMDGPLCPPRISMAMGDRGIYTALDIPALTFINNLLREDPFLGLVISSSWRVGRDTDFFYHVFGALGLRYLKSRLCEDWKTKVLGLKRGEEVEEWLGRHPEIENYVILDDDSDFLENQKDKLVLADPRDGLLFKHFIQIRDILYPKIQECEDPTGCKSIILRLEDLKEDP